jgi:hypothetical protein
MKNIDGGIMTKLLLISLLLIQACSQIQPISSESSERVPAQALSGIVKNFLIAVSKSSDNIQKESVEKMEQKLLKELQSNPAKYGLKNSDEVKQLSKLDDPKYERALSELIADAPRILKLTSKMTKEGVDAIQAHAGVAARMRLSVVDLKKVKVDPSKECKLGRDLSKKIVFMEEDIVASKLATVEEAKEIGDAIRRSAQSLADKSKNDPTMRAISQQIIEYSTLISQKTGKKFIGKGGCMKLSGKDVFNNKAEIAYRTLKDVEETGVNDIKGLKKTLQKNHSSVTGRTAKESCLAIRALTVGDCADVYARNLASECK